VSAELHIANTLRLAHEDLEAAELLAARGNRYDAYHAQQAGEKILLALLISEDIRAERRDAHRLDVCGISYPTPIGLNVDFPD
jgi:HEPN domain-containing protein